MINYQVKNIPEAKAMVIQGPFLQGSIPINLPDDDALKKEYISLFLNRKDIEIGLDSLQLVSIELNPQINYSLFLTGLFQLTKCFQQSDARVPLHRERFKKRIPNCSADFDKYMNWRNNYFVHDGGGLKEGIACLLLAPESADTVLGGPVSVLWHDKQSIDYIKESATLESLMQAVWRFTESEIDSKGEILFKKYNSKTREEIYSYGAIGVSCNSLDEYSIDQIKAMNPHSGKN